MAGLVNDFVHHRNGPEPDLRCREFILSVGRHVFTVTVNEIVQYCTIPEFRHSLERCGSTLSLVRCSADMHCSAKRLDLFLLPFCINLVLQTASQCIHERVIGGVSFLHSGAGQHAAASSRQGKVDLTSRPLNITDNSVFLLSLLLRNLRNGVSFKMGLNAAVL